jgi:hypothetical protein
MKQVFLKAVDPIKGRKGDWLRQQVRQAHEPLDLWLLRGPVLSVLRHDGSRGLRADLYRSLDALIDQVRAPPPRPSARAHASSPGLSVLGGHRPASLALSCPLTAACRQGPQAQSRG